LGRPPNFHTASAHVLCYNSAIPIIELNPFQSPHPYKQYIEVVTARE
jgi:hypothetical protein